VPIYVYDVHMRAGDGSGITERQGVVSIARSESVAKRQVNTEYPSAKIYLRQTLPLKGTRVFAVSDADIVSSF
jgi:hypothetical protein